MREAPCSIHGKTLCFYIFVGFLSLVLAILKPVKLFIF